MNNEVNVTKNKSMEYLVKLDRLAAWVLLVVAILYGITGYGMTKDLIDPQLASSLHLGWLGLIGLIAFVIHTAWAIHLFFKRHCAWNIVSKIGLALFYIILIGFFLFMQFVYSSIMVSDKYQPITKTNFGTIAKANVFTAATLKQYNGLNGQPAYVAVDGVVYDMSSVYINGQHHGYSAGLDLTDAFYAQHPADFLKRVPAVGTYQRN